MRPAEDLAGAVGLLAAEPLRTPPILRVYDPPFQASGYPVEWDTCTRCGGVGWLCAHSDDPADVVRGRCCGGSGTGCPSMNGCPECLTAGSAKDAARAIAGLRCERCRHPYAQGAGEWSRCDDRCRHRDRPDEVRRVPRIRNRPDEVRRVPRIRNRVPFDTSATLPPESAGTYEIVTEARWRILTVHHLNGRKEDLRWWNLAALCQRCHLEIQGRVVMERAWILEHTDWFRPHAAGWYAVKYLDTDLDRQQTIERLDELLDLERPGGNPT